MPENINVSIRFPSELRTTRHFNPLVDHWSTHLLYPSFSSQRPRLDQMSSAPFYYGEGFISIVYLIIYYHYYNLTCSSSSCSGPVTDSFRSQRLPYPPYTADYLFENLNTYIPLFILFSLIYACMNTVHLITFEKQCQLKLAMEMLGLKCWLHWMAWFSRTLILILIIASSTVILFKVVKMKQSTFSTQTFNISMEFVNFSVRNI